MPHATRTRPRLAARLAGVGLALLLGACALPTLPFERTSQAPTPAPVATSTPAGPTATALPADLAPAAADEVQPALLRGEMIFTSDYLFDAYTQNAAMLIDMHGFVIRDEEWEIPLEGQVLGPLEIDRAAGRASYRLSLPAIPTGVFSDVDNNGREDRGVQIFNVTWTTSLNDSPFDVGDDSSRGWASGFASTRHDSDNDEEVLGGKLVVWAPDAEQQFPTAFGPDGLLFSEDDPVGPLPGGYSVIDLDAEPFGIVREPEQQLDLFEPQDIAAKDYSSLSYGEAFEALVADVRDSYAFKGIPDKEPDWDALLAELGPRVRDAERSGDGAEFYRALRDFTLAFNDGHVALSYNDVGYEVFNADAGGGFGFAVAETDDGRFLATYVDPSGPAGRAGMQVGAELQRFDGRPTGEAVSAVRPIGGPYSSPHTRRLDQATYLLRVPVGSSAEITFANPAGGAQSTTLRAVSEYGSLFANSIYQDSPPTQLPVEAEILDSGVGYIRVSSNFDDLHLTLNLFERALAIFQEEQVPGLIIDMRQNGGGFPLGLAGYLGDEEIVMGQQEKYIAASGRYEPEGEPDTVEPKERRFDFPRVAVMVGPACASACEDESYALSQIPGAVVVGHYPSAGVYAAVVPDEYRMPDGLTLQFSKWRYTLPDGSLFLEGQGVVPGVEVPVTEASLLGDEDVELAAAEAEILR
jgi:C-terminal processing protease CtpA/Prc